MTSSVAACPSAQGRALDLSASAFGGLERTDPRTVSWGEMRGRLEDQGYLLLSEFLPREEVLATRGDLLVRMGAGGLLREGSDPQEAIPSAAAKRGVLNDLALESPALQQLLYGSRMTAFYEELFGEPVRHFDFTWLRAYPPGPGTGPHMDSVFMNRGTPHLMTAWTPLGDIDPLLGGVAVLEGSVNLERIRSEYGSRDVDAYCLDSVNADLASRQETMVWSGTISEDPVSLREELGLRWLTTDYRAGDVLTFPIHTIHIGLDNNSDRLRLSSDSRYQPASEPADPRWVGPKPSAHGSRSKQGIIC